MFLNYTFMSARIDYIVIKVMQKIKKQKNETNRIKV
jgi:hypothetical protein